MIVLGVRSGHDASACIVNNGVIIANVAEERFTRIKNDGSFPIQSIDYCLKQANITSKDIDILTIPANILPIEYKIFFDFPKEYSLTKFLFKASNTVNKLTNRKGVVTALETKEINDIDYNKVEISLPLYQNRFKLSASCKIYLVGHHLSHASSAAYTSGWDNEDFIVATMDGRGDGISNAIWKCKKNTLQCMDMYDGNSSLGWFYACATEALGWRQNRGEWKLMGLASYGKRCNGILDNLHPRFYDGKLEFEYKYSNFGRWNDHGANHYNNNLSKVLKKIVHEVGRENFSAEVQAVVERETMNLILPRMKKYGLKKLSAAGGFFLNVKLNQKLWYSKEISDFWVFPDAGDAGLSLGSVLFVNNYLKKSPCPRLNSMYLGPSFSNEEIKFILDQRHLKYNYYDNIHLKAAELLAKNNIIGWFQGRMEFGPRALGNRSILANPIIKENHELVNKRIKFRESFRPFCPTVLYEDADDYLQKSFIAEHMVVSFEATEKAKNQIPAVIHVDNTVRPQILLKEKNKLFYKLLQSFKKLTGVPVVLNTSFNIRGEPIVCTPSDAIKCFFDTGMDAVIIGNYIISKK